MSIQVLDRVLQKYPCLTIIEGGALGADRLARVWAESRSVPHVTYPADWKQHGKAAGRLRNRQMLRDGKPDAVIAFPGGAGTHDMITIAEAAGLPVWQPFAAVPTCD